MRAIRPATSSSFAALLLALAACASEPAPARFAPVEPSDGDDLPGALSPSASAADGKADSTAQALLPDDIHWLRNSAEYQAAARQAYRLAALALEAELARAPRDPGSWGVIFDVDETLLDNSTYEKSRVGRGYSATAWRAWVRRREAPAIPGAVAFAARVIELGGRVAVVSNRSHLDCAATRENLEQVGIAAAVVLCKTGVSSKAARWQSVEQGTAAEGVAPIEPLLFVGDSITDFPSLDQNARLGGDEAFVDFGSRFIVIPNPMYGSWEKSPRD